MCLRQAKMRSISSTFKKLQQIIFQFGNSQTFLVICFNLFMANTWYFCNVWQEPISSQPKAVIANEETFEQKSYLQTTNQSCPQIQEDSVSTETTWIFVITPTHKRITQKADLTALSQTLQLVKEGHIHWILVEDSQMISPMCERLLKRSGLPYTHLAVQGDTRLPGRGMTQRNLGMGWIRAHFKNRKNFKAVVYFADDDNTYDIRVFQHIRSVKGVGVWPVALVGGAWVESPKVQNGKVVDWDVYATPNRIFATDMAGFATNLELILAKPEAEFNSKCQRGLFEQCFLFQLGFDWKQLEPFAVNWGSEQKEILVWHTSTVSPKVRHGSKMGFEL